MVTRILETEFSHQLAPPTIVADQVMLKKRVSEAGALDANPATKTTGTASQLAKAEKELADHIREFGDRTPHLTF